MEHAQDRTAILAAVHGIARDADRRQWDAVRSWFAPRVVLDYGVPELLTPEQIIARWQPLLSAFDSTQHLIRDETITFAEPARARVTSTFQATHHLAAAEGGDIWTLSGTYEHELVRDETGWKVTRMRMIPGASSGNPALLALAGARAGLPAPAPAAYRVEHVRFPSRGDTIVGLLHLPADAEASEPLPAVVVLGSWTTVKEQMPMNYARHLAPAGFAVLTMDFRGFGESEGTPRSFESPAHKIDDIRAAVDFLAAHPAIDPGRIGLVGVCASSGYVAQEAAADQRVRSLALIAPWLHDATLVDTVYGGPEGVAAKVRAGQEARARFASSGHTEMVPAASADDPRAAMYVPQAAVLAYYLDPARGGIPQWGNRFALMSWPAWLGFDALAAAPGLRTPTLIVHAETAAIPDGAHRFAAAMPVRPREVWLEGPSQFDFYDDPATVARAAGEAIAHLRATLVARGDEDTLRARGDEDTLRARGDEDTLRGRNRAVVARFFHTLEAFDIDAFARLFAEDGKQIMPFAPQGFPRLLDGRGAIFNQYRDMPRNFSSMRFPDLAIHDMADPARFFVTYRGEIQLRAGGQYNNEYAGLFVIRGGHIVEFHEYFDPIVLQRAFGASLLDAFNAGT